MDEQRRAAGDPDVSASDAEAIRPEPPTWQTERRPLWRTAAEPDEAAEPREDARPDGAQEPDEALEPDESDGSSGGIVSHIQSVAGPVADAIGSIFGAASQAWSDREAVIGRRLSRQAREPLANLYELYPEARQASPHELGMRFVPVEDIRGTAVAGAAQRGGDFLPLKPFRGENWEARWRRLRQANERLQPLPPVDLIKYDGDYWVVDGHNRVAVTLYANGVGLDAMVTELVPLDGQTSERPRHLLSYLGETAELRAAAQGHRPAIGMRQVEQQSSDEAAIVLDVDLTADHQAHADHRREAELDEAGSQLPPDAGQDTTGSTSLGEAD
jgi:hypothetical protein